MTYAKTLLESRGIWYTHDEETGSKHGMKKFHYTCRWTRHASKWYKCNETGTIIQTVFCYNENDFRKLILEWDGCGERQRVNNTDISYQYFV